MQAVNGRLARLGASLPPEYARLLMWPILYPESAHVAMERELLMRRLQRVLFARYLQRSAGL